MNREKFVEAWGSAIERGSAAAFIGAGLSQRAGYKSWRGLLREIADELSLDIEQEHDLAAVAQYSLNRSVGKRSRLTSLIRREFAPKSSAPEPFRALARLPLRHVWTTNYDTLPEVAWLEERKGLDVKSRNEDLGSESPWAHTILYKMHGTVEHPDEIVIAKDDYELYRQKRPGFLQLLAGQLIGSQFLFLGFSFTDPNLSHLFGSIRETFRDTGPEHYALVRRPNRKEGPVSKKRFETDKVRYNLWVQDLQRYGIRCIEVERYEEFDEILQETERFLARKNVFVSGSYPDTLTQSDAERRRFVESVAGGLGRLIAERSHRLISGFGLTVGSAVITGALSVILSQDAPNLERSLLLRPFPKRAPKGSDEDEFKRMYRHSMLSQAGIALFVCGLKDVHGTGRASESVIADGVIEEFETARQLQRVVIPIGATGGAAAELWKRVDHDFDKLWPAQARLDFNLLNDPRCTPEELVSAVGRLIDSISESKLDKRKGRAKP